MPLRSGGAFHNNKLQALERGGKATMTKIKFLEHDTAIWENRIAGNTIFIFDQEAKPTQYKLFMTATPIVVATH